MRSVYSSIAAALLLSACSSVVPAPSGAPVASAPSASVPASAATSAASIPASAAAEASIAASVSPSAGASSSGQAVEFEGVSFTIDGQLGSAAGRTVPAMPVSPAPGLGGAAPEHVRFTFGSDSTVFNPRTPQLMIYPTAEMDALDPQIAQTIDDLRALLDARSIGNVDSIPVFPLIPAAQVLRAQTDILEFDGGAGARFVTAYAQNAAPLSNEQVFYTFQGLTNDGQYYVSLFWPVTTAVLPATDAEAQASIDPATFGQQFDQYRAALVDRLNAEPGDRYTPDLFALDGLVRSIRINR